MAPLFRILSCESSVASDQALCKLAEFLGLQTELITLRGNLADPPPALLAPAPDRPVLALGGALLQQLYQRDWFAKLLTETRFVLVYGFAPAEGESPELKWLTAGALSSVTAISADSNQFTIHSDVRFGGFPVLGKSYSAESPATGFSVAAGTDVQSYITVNGYRHFLSIARGRSVVFLLAEPELVDIDKVLSPELSLRPWYAQLIAVTIFLRSAFGDWCWSSPVIGATLTVDDPYLRRRYGFVHYETLVEQLEKTRGALTVAFIPYNYRRSDPRTIELLRRHSDHFSICVHGCDHTGGEFASLDEAWLMGTTSCALERMESHKDRTQMPFDNVMIFPQGRFSTTAIRAAKACGIAAAVNTTPWPVDCRDNSLTIRDLLGVAVTRYESFPIFGRRYPRDLFDYAFDAMFQKPVLAVEHHGFFRHGHTALVKLVQEVSTLSPKVVWMPLGRTLTTSCVLKRTGDDHFALRHFAPVVSFRNPAPSELTLSVEKPEQHGQVEAVLVGNQKVPFEVHSGFLRYAARLAVGEELNATVLYRQTPRPRRSPSWKYRLAASTRRMLSNVRDNQLAKSERILKLAEQLKNMLASRKRSGGRSS